MGATTVTGRGQGDSNKRIAYVSTELPKDQFTKTSSNPQDLITGDIPVNLQCNETGDPRGTLAVDWQCCRTLDSQVASGDYSVIGGGCNNTASGNYSVVEGGKNNTASGIYSHAEGQQTVASGGWTHAEGFQTTASAGFSHAEGYGSIASGYTCHAEGFACISEGFANHAEGWACTVMVDGAHAEGHSTLASVQFTHAEGVSTVASNYGSHAEGAVTTASGAFSHAEGYYATASGFADHAEGNTTRASGGYSHAEGSHTLASGINSHAEGSNTIASGLSSHAQGVSAVATLRGQDSQSSGPFSSGTGGTGAGTAQTTVVTMIGFTDNITPTVKLTLNGGAADPTTRFIIQSGNAYLFFVEIVAKGSNGIASFVRYFLINDNNPGVSLVGAVQTIGTDIGSNAGSPPVGWTVNITADALNQCISIEVANSSVAPSDFTRWVARVQATEVKLALAL